MRRFVSFVVLAITLAGCDSVEDQLVGEWLPLEDERDMSVRFSADSTFVFRTGDFSGEGHYRIDPARQLVLEPTGALASVIPAGFIGELFVDSLTLCNPAGVCSTFSRSR